MIALRSNAPAVFDLVSNQCDVPFETVHAIITLWCGGRNTHEIGQRLGLDESVVVSVVHAWRDRRRRP